MGSGSYVTYFASNKVFIRSEDHKNLSGFYDFPWLSEYLKTFLVFPYGAITVPLN